MTLLRRGGGGELLPVAQAQVLPNSAQSKQSKLDRNSNKSKQKPAVLCWAHSFKSAELGLDSKDFDSPNSSFAIHMEEVDLMRPATYPDEPRINTSRDDVFAETGPRFMGLLPIDDLKETV
jgi:hypothetical protein